MHDDVDLKSSRRGIGEVVFCGGYDLLALFPRGYVRSDWQGADCVSLFEVGS